MKYLMTIVCGLLLFASCKKHDDSTPTIAKRTVIVYVSAENNLSDYATSDLNEMIKGAQQLSDNQNLIAFIDKADASLPSIVRFKGGQQEVDTDYAPTEDFLNSDPEKFYDVLAWITNKYKAESYGLVLWGHADGGIIENDSVEIAQGSRLRKAYGIDNGDNSGSASVGKWMNIPSMHMALKALGIQWKFIFADCCNMSSAEVAYELRDVAEYLIGSPGEIPGDGAPYDLLVPDFFGTSADFYKKIVDDYADRYSSTVPLAVIQLSEMAQLAQATRQALAAVNPVRGASDTPNPYGLIYYYGSVNLDLRVLQDIQDYFYSYAPTDSYATWKQAFDRAVIYKRKAERWMTNGIVNFYNFTVTDDNYGGMCMFFPMERFANRTWNQTMNQLGWYYAVNWSAYGW